MGTAWLTAVAVTDVVADVVGEGADGEGELVGGVGVAEKTEDEVAGADVVGEVGEEDVAEGVVAEVLDGTAAVGVGVGLLKLGFGEGGVVLEENGADGLLPGEIDELFVGLDGIGDGMGAGEEQGAEGCDAKEDASARGFGCWFDVWNTPDTVSVWLWGRVSLKQ